MSDTFLRQVNNDGMTHVDFAEALQAAENSYGNLLNVGEEVFSRDLIQAINASLVAQRFQLTYFTARKTETINNLVTVTGSTAAGATPTLCRMGLYSIDGAGNGTLVASTPNDTTLWAAINTRYSRVVSVPVLKTKGQRYAFGILIDTAAALPFIISSISSTAVGIANASPPRLSAHINGQANLPSSFLVGSLANAVVNFYGELLP